MTQHALTQTIPTYLKTFIAKQDPSLYTQMDHASWRFILKLSEDFFSHHAHQKYLSGLIETGISKERIPLISEMDQCLKKFNWRAVPVTGFIPPAAFMEFLSLGILPIACDMRKLEHLAYTPAPDIVHEAAGHAPILADPEYADYLRSYGEISQKAIFSSQDMEVYQAIRHLSDTKEDPTSTDEMILLAQSNLDQAVAHQTYESEATLLARMGWWTFEYGMVGDLTRPKIYGAGLLSSLGESYHCFDGDVKKIPFSIDCIEKTYDITRPQPQLFVSPDFQSLKEALGELANRMAFRRGGIEGLQKALQAGTVTTCMLDTGVQVSGKLTRFIQDDLGCPCYLQYQGPTQLSYQYSEIPGQDATYHKEGFGTSLARITELQLSQAGLSIGGGRGLLELESGVSIEGKLENSLSQEGHLILLTFADCTVKKGSEILFRPEWGKYDLICGREVVSVFGGAADRTRYLEAVGGFHQESGRMKTNLTEANRELNRLYGKVRQLREAARWDQLASAQLEEVYGELEKKYPDDWLLRIELLELNLQFHLKLPWENVLRKRLNEIAKQTSEKNEMIQRGLRLLEKVGDLNVG